MACGPGAPKSGTVVGKRFEPFREWEETYYHSQCIAHNKDGVCTSYINIPYQVHRTDDEDWMVQLEECHYDDNNGERKCRTGWREISQRDWESLEVGDFYGQREDGS